MRIRKAKLSDIGQIMDLEHRCFSDSLWESSEIYEDRIENHESYVAVSPVNDFLVYGAIFVEFDRIASNAVFPESQNRGVSSTLLDHVISQSSSLRLEVCREWITAKRLYESRGFTYTGESYDRGGFEMLVMRRH